MTRGDTTKELDKRHAFYTPLPWVLRCHMTMDKIFGLGWREQVVWDFACGENNMTKWSPYEFRLYSFLGICIGFDDVDVFEALEHRRSYTIAELCGEEEE